MTARSRDVAHGEQQELRFRVHARPYRHARPIHHVTYAVDSREEVCAPPISAWKKASSSKPARTSTPCSKRFSCTSTNLAATAWKSIAPARAYLGPRLEADRVDRAERAKGQAWGLKTVESFHTYGTPPVDVKHP